MWSGRSHPVCVAIAFKKEQNSKTTLTKTQMDESQQAHQSHVPHELVQNTGQCATIALATVQLPDDL